ncbi:hypothetical protein WR25_14828 isoform B [Diploscapter pachys]|uniref:Uncharacterized protein n=1 Tax=Diploscapter pachys TaxID=2018661 RepID=A0A2A2KNA5_9BILA|nr:hypothetical protein WR25_14828 isoform A [Diploscapter pachys]PAV75338.1 hypothetical protein WR25_14828 isoform B [Diploscapter pachys]
MLRKPEDTALYELDSRISAMERRLRNAKTARDSYLTFLKQKYPAWKPTFSANYSIDPGRNIVGELSTSNYHWDVGIEKRHRPKFQANKIQEKLYSKIPQGGPYLESDLKRVRQRLEEISQQLRLIRDTRLNLSTEDYLKSRHLLDENAEESFELETSNLANIRLKLENLNTDSYSPIETPTRDKIEDLKAEEFHETYIEDIKSGKIQPSYLMSSEASGNLNQFSEAKTETSIEPRRVISFASQVPKVEEKIAEPERTKVETPKTKEGKFQKILNDLRYFNLI